MPYKDPENKRLYNKLYRAKNRERLLKNNRELWKQNKEKYGASHDNWYYKNREKVLLKRRENYIRSASDPNFRKTVNAQRKELRDKYRALAIDHYGGKCVCCGESTKEFLSFDHVAGGGSKDRKGDLRGRSMGIWLAKKGFPEKFQLLCHNCNLARGFYGYCPHQRKGVRKGVKTRDVPR
jgi:hypothetical protein